MSLLAKFGVDAGKLASHNTGPAYPKPVQGRVAHIDADFLAYQVSAESKDELEGRKPRRSFEDMQHNARVAANHIMRLAGATEFVCHVTPSGSDKGGRDGQAVQQEYQANRKDRTGKPEFLEAVRSFIGAELNGRMHFDQEADDGLAQAGYHDSNAIVCSKDKDLRMVPGLHLDMYTGEIVSVRPDEFGGIELERKYKEDGTVRSTKLVGYGPKFFFAQCLMGDQADFIKGAPKVPASIIGAKSGKPGLCGAVAAHKLLDPIDNIRDAFQLVKNVFTLLESEHDYEFTHWQTGAKVTGTQALLGDMLLLWMRRNKNPMDVIAWLKEQK